jgi:signal transduction histidine kinase
MRFLFKFQRLPVDFDSPRSRRIIFRYYLLILAFIYGLGTILELIVDFQNISVWLMLTLTVFPLVVLYLSLKGVSHRLLVTTNLIFIIVLNQLQLLEHPNSFHVAVFWLGAIPQVIAVMTTFWEMTIWSAILTLFIIANGIYLSNVMPSYTMTLYPIKFMTGGTLFILMMFCIGTFYRYTQNVSRDRLQVQNQKLKTLQKEIERQNIELKNKNEEINSMLTHVADANKTLEQRVKERTVALELQNEKLAEYAFINSHLLRAPLARILGLTNIISRSTINEEERELIDYLKIASHDLDDVVTKISKAIDDGDVSREAVKKLS